VRHTPAKFDRAVAGAKAALPAADRYMNCGQDAPLYATLWKAVVAAKRLVRRWHRDAGAVWIGRRLKAQRYPKIYQLDRVTLRMRPCR
jgi:hypothetical protein